MNKSERDLLKMLFYGTGGQYFEALTKSGLRKPAIRTVIKNVFIQDGGFNREIWSVEIDWALLKKWFEVADEGEK